jgi:hypothetical protein
MATTLPAGSRARPLAQTGASRAIAYWLLACCALVFAIVVVGGVTRLTHSGLSITEWQPISARCRCRKPMGRRLRGTRRE